MEKIVAGLEKVDKEICSGIYQMSQDLSQVEIIKLFNNQANTFYNLLTQLANKYHVSREMDIASYRTLFDAAIKYKSNLPVEKYTEYVLPLAADIYSENEETFLNINLGDEEINVAGKCGIIKIDVLKNLWKKITDQEKADVKNNIISITTYSQAYFYKVFIK